MRFFILERDMPCVRLMLPCLLLLLAITLAPAVEGIGIGTLNLETVFKECTLVQQNSDRLGMERRKAKSEIDTREAELKELQGNFKLIPQDRPIWAETKEKVEVANVRFKLFTERRVQELQQMEAQLIKESYLELRKLLGEYADEKGLSLIYITSSSEMNAGQVQEVRLEISMRQVIYSDPKLDITKDFVVFANARVAVPKTGVPEVAPPPAAPPATEAPGDPAKDPGFDKTPPAKVP